MGSLLDKPLPKFIDTLIYLSSWSGFFAILLGFFDLLLRKTGFAIELSAILSLMACGALFLLIKNNNQMHHVAGICTRKEFTFSLLLIAIGLILFFFPVIYASYIMGGGEYPRMFFNVDSPYHLSQALALRSSLDFPPASLNNSGVKFLYHYGAQLSADSISRIGGIAVHTAYFICLPFLLFTGIFFALLKISAVRNRGYILSPLIFLGLFFNTEWLFWADLNSVNVFNIEAFLGGYPHISILASIYLFLFAIMHYEKFDLSFSSGVVVVLALALIVLEKSAYVFASAGFFLGVILRKALLDKNVRNSVVLGLLYLIGVLAMASVVSGNPSELLYTGLLSQAGSRNLSVSPVVLLMIAPLVFSRKSLNRQVVAEYFPYILAIILPMFIYLSFDLRIGGKSDPNIRQAVALGYIFMAAIFVKIIYIPSLNLWAKWSSLLIFMVIAVPVIANRINSAILFVENKTGWHEYVNNESLAECLSRVPVKGSMLVTNDLRYPADNFTRDMMQLQIPALFGHTMYAGNAKYESNFADLTKFDEQRALIEGSVGEISHLAQLRGWTHGIVFKRKAYIRGDWKVICENDAVLIYSYN